MANAYNSITITNVATLITAGKNFRRGTIIFNGGASAVYLGMDSAVTTSNGLPLLSNATFFNNGYLDLWRGPIYGVVASGTADIRYWDWEEV